MKNEFESNKFAHVLLYPVSWSFSKIVKLRKKYAKKPVGRYSYFFDRYPAVNAMRTGAKKHLGVESIYNYTHIKGKSSILETFWMSARNCQSLRNRLRIVKTHINQEILRHTNNRSEKMIILSLAAGSARSVLETAGGNNSVEIIALDSSDEAINYSKNLAQKLQATNINWHKKDLLAVDTFIDEDKKAHLVEVVGLFEYLDDDQILSFLENVKKNMTNDAVLITSQIHPNSEAHIIKEIVDWDMTHRTKDRFISLMEKAGFEIVDATTEPHRIHTILKLRKKNK